MRLVLGLFLTVATAGAIAQQYTPASNPRSLPDAVQSPSPEPSRAEATAAGDTNLPDAPSYASQQKSVTAPPPYRQFFSPVPNTATSRSLVFSGGIPGGTDAHQPNDHGANGGANCGRGSLEKTDGGWF